MNITDNIFVDCGMYLKHFKKAIVSDNNILINHTYATGETKPNVLMHIEDCIGNIHGNSLVNESSDDIDHMIDVLTSNLLIATNTYKSIAGDFVNTDAQSSIEQYGNMEFD